MDYQVLGLLAAAVIIAVNAIAPKVGISAALLLVVLGVGFSLVPGTPEIRIEPEWILAGVLPPLLYSTSVGMPAMDFRRDLTAISGLSVTLVVLTSVVLGFVFSALIPGVGLALGIALGAIISPTDAVATAIVRRLGVSPRVVTVLEGESLLNDASALVLLRSAVAATVASVSLWHVAGNFVYAVLVAVALGGVVGRLSLVARAKIADAHLSTAISFLVPFVAYLPAERLGASGLVATVAAGLVSGYGSAKYLRPQDRITETANWRTLELLLEGAVFLLMGLQLHGLVLDVRAEHGSLVLALGAGALAAFVAIAVRTAYLAPLLWALQVGARRGSSVKDYLTDLDGKIDEHGQLPAGTLRTGPQGRRSLPDGATSSARREGRVRRAARDDDRRAGRGRTELSLRARITRQIADIDYLAAEPFGWREGAVLVWAGMRGVVTLAAAQSLPPNLPQRSLLVLIAFVAAVSTLLVQSSSLPWLVRRLGLVRTADDAEQARLIDDLEVFAVDAVDQPGLRRADGRPYDELVLTRARQALRANRSEAGDDSAGIAEPRAAQYRELRLAMIEAQRIRLLEARSVGTFSSAALNRALAVLDADQISTELRTEL